MCKQKVTKIEPGMMYGDWQEIFVNGNRHTFNIYWTPSTVLEELSKYYDFSYLDEKDLEVMW